MENHTMNTTAFILFEASMKSKKLRGLIFAIIILLAAVGVRADTLIGDINRIDVEKKEIIVHVKGDRPLQMGERVYVNVDGQKAVMTATFPMLSSSKCVLEPKYSGLFGRLQKGMSVFSLASGGEKAQKSETAGTRLFSKILGGTELDVLKDIRQTRDGGYIVIGTTSSNDGNVIGNHGSEDVWVVKLDASGTIQWQRCLGGPGNDTGRSVQQTPDGGYIIAADTSSVEGDIMGNHGRSDIWVIKLDASGNVQWRRCYGGANDDTAGNIQVTSDGGYILIGTTNSSDGDMSDNHGGSDMWVARLDAAGHIQWQRSLGGSGTDNGFSVIQMRDGGYLLAGQTSSTNDDVSGETGSNVPDGWLVKLDASGQTRWQRVLSGCETLRCGIIGQNGNDAIVVLEEERASYRHEGCVFYAIESLMEVDTTGVIRWRRSFRDDMVRSSGTVERLANGEYVLAYVTEITRTIHGQEQQFYATVVERIDVSGRIRLRRQLGAVMEADRYFECEAFVMIRQVGDGGYMLAGTVDTANRDSNGNSNFDILVAKIDQNGNSAPVQR